MNRDNLPDFEREMGAIYRNSRRLSDEEELYAVDRFLDAKPSIRIREGSLRNRGHDDPPDCEA